MNKWKSHCDDDDNGNPPYSNIESNPRSIVYEDDSEGMEPFFVGNELDMSEDSVNKEIKKWNRLICAYKENQFVKELWDAGMFRLILYCSTHHFPRAQFSYTGRHQQPYYV